MEKVEKVRIEVHPELDLELRKLQAKLLEKINHRDGLNVILPIGETSRVAAKILRENPQKIIIKTIYKKRGRIEVVQD